MKMDDMQEQVEMVLHELAAAIHERRAVNFQDKGIPAWIDHILEYEFSRPVAPLPYVYKNVPSNTMSAISGPISTPAPRPGESWPCCGATTMHHHPRCRRTVRPISYGPGLNLPLKLEEHERAELPPQGLNLPIKLSNPHERTAPFGYEAGEAGRRAQREDEKEPTYLGYSAEQVWYDEAYQEDRDHDVEAQKRVWETMNMEEPPC